MTEVLAQLIEGQNLPLNWGIKPVLFTILGINIPSYSFFVLLGLVVGIIVFYFETRKHKSISENTFYIFIAGILGGILGAKIPAWIINYKSLISHFSLSLFLSGRTLVGGLIGGFIAIELTKKYLGIKERRGNLFAPAIAIGVAIGRIGCFLRGCCYGKPTSLPWGVNFGDGVLRHPTQIYESIFMLGMFIYLQHRKSKNPYPGQLFKILMVSYFTFRFFIEFIRVEPVVFAGLTLYQWVSVFVIFYFIKADIKSFINQKRLNKQ